MLRLENVYAETGCRPIMVGHSFGGLLAYMTLARYEERAARVTAGIVYATSPFQGSAPKVHGANRVLLTAQSAPGPLRFRAQPKVHLAA